MYKIPNMPDIEVRKRIEFDFEAQSQVGRRVGDAVSSFFDPAKFTKPGEYKRTAGFPYDVSVTKVKPYFDRPAGYVAVARSYGIPLADLFTPTDAGKLQIFTLHVLYPHHHAIGAEPELEPISIIGKTSKALDGRWLVEIHASVQHMQSQGNDLTAEDGQRMLELHGLL